MMIELITRHEYRSRIGECLCLPLCKRTKKFVTEEICERCLDWLEDTLICSGFPDLYLASETQNLTTEDADAWYFVQTLDNIISTKTKQEENDK